MQTGDKAPELLGRDENGNEVRLSDFAGRKLALYFYPKDMTSGCTSQACNLRDNYKELKAAGYEVVGVSVDDEKSHQKFIAKNELPFPLIADTEKKLVEEFGVWGDPHEGGNSIPTTHADCFSCGSVVQRPAQRAYVIVKTRFPGPTPHTAEHGSPAKMPLAKARDIAKRHSAQGHHPAVYHACGGSPLQFFGGKGRPVALLGNAVEHGAERDIAQTSLAPGHLGQRVARGRHRAGAEISRRRRVAAVQVHAHQAVVAAEAEMVVYHDAPAPQLRHFFHEPRAFIRRCAGLAQVEHVKPQFKKPPYVGSLIGNERRGGEDKEFHEF